jgi:ABC-type sugar transport system ATPase subunit
MPLTLLDITKHFGVVLAVDSFTLSINDGEFIVLLGPSGCGKTTVIRIIAGLEHPDSGQVKVSGDDWTQLPPQRRDVAMVFQQYALYPQRSVRGNIEYPLRLRGVNSKERSDRVNQISILLGIHALLDRRPSQLSGGEAQRVALARALVREPSCFLMDEPLSNLDAQLRIRARAEIKRIQRQLKVTTLYVTHDQDEAVALADRIAVMNEGRLAQVGTPEEIFHRPATSFVAGFVGAPPINLLKAIVTAAAGEFVRVILGQNDGGSDSSSVTIKMAAPVGRRLTVGFRPDHVKIIRNEDEGLSQPSWLLPGAISLVEGLEPEYVAHCDTSAGAMLVRTSQKPAEGPTKLSLPAAMAHFFDAETGERIE